MPHRPLPYRSVAGTLRELGFSPRTVRGSHVKFVRVDAAGTRVAIVPRHLTIAAGTLRSIARQAGVPVERFYTER